LFELQGYSLEEKIHESANSVVYRATRESDNQTVYIKALPEELPPPNKLTRLRREYNMTRGFDDEGVIKALDLVRIGHSLAIVLENFGGLSLDRSLTVSHRNLENTLKIAIGAARSVESVHAGQIIHKDVSPSNLVWDRKTGQLKIIDFGISTELSRETPSLMNPEVVEGTLAFMSPEQTGRMNRMIDYRTDLYSLGATLYWIFTGSLPFAAREPLELAHCHLARMPMAPHVRDSSVPKVVSEIVLKLMAKNAEDRYQSASGLRRDLQRCLDTYLQDGQLESFKLGGRDVSSNFSIPERLYGRDREVATLLKDFDRAAGGDKALMLVAGYSGIGKSALVHEVHKPIVARRGYFIAGKFDQFRRNVPFDSLVQALKGLVQQLLTESEDRLAMWKRNVQTAVGVNGQIILDVIPEAELVLGSQPPVAELGPLEALNRFNRVLVDFIRVFASAAHPLTLFLDDLQWADAPSLALLEQLMTEVETQHIFLVGAYRDNEVSPTHPLILTLNEIEEAGTPVTTITLGPLAREHVAQLVADTLSGAVEDVGELTEICLTKTGGNPFFLRRFLHAVYEKNGLNFDRESRAWNWDQAAVKAMQITDNVVDLMSQKIKTLPQETQDVLQLGACIGASFDLHTLSIVSESTPVETASALWEALKAGLVLPVGGDYKFLREHAGGSLGNPHQVRYRWLHDRVQQAAYALIAEDHKELVHHQLGQRMLSNLSPEERDEKLFEIARHLNLGAGQRKKESERDSLAELNLEVGRKAIDTVAFRTAQSLLEAGLELLGDDAWERCYDLTLALTTEAARATHLIPDFPATERHFSSVKKNARDVLDRVRACEVWVTACQAQNNIGQGLDDAFEIFNALGYPFPEDPDENDIGAYLQRAGEAIAGRSVEELAALPTNTDPKEVAAIRLMMIVAPPAYIGRPNLFPIFGLEAVALSASNGNTGASSFAYVLYSTLLSGILEEFDQAMQFAELGQRMIKKYNAMEYVGRVAYVPNCFVIFWKKHLREAWSGHPESYRLALENGDLEFACWSIMKRCQQGFFMGLPLAGRAKETRDYVATCFRLKQATSGSYAQATLQAMLGLMGESEDPCELVGEVFDEKALRPRYVEANEAFGLCNLHLTKAHLYYLWDRWEDTITQFELAAPYAAGMLSLYHFPLFHFYVSLSQMALAREADPEERAALLAAADESIARMAKWAQHCPENFLHKHHLMAGNRAMVDGRFEEAESHFERGIRAADAQGYLQEQALGCELLGRSWLEREEPALAESAFAQASQLYGVWGASAKVAQLKAKHSVSVPGPARFSPTTSTERLSGLDIETVLKSTHALSSEVQRESLLRTFLDIMLENAGARAGVLTRETPEGAFIEVRGGVDALTEVYSDTTASDYPRLPQSVINLVRRTREPVVVDDLLKDLRFSQDTYLQSVKPLSLLCLPVEHQGKLVAILYLENDLTPGAFTEDRVELLGVLLNQLAISLDNARLYSQMEGLVEQRTRELAEAQDKLATSLLEQKQKAEGENKAKSLFLATLSHEIRTPLNAIVGLAALCSSCELPPKASDYLTKIRSSSESLMGIVQNVVDLSKVEAGKVELERTSFDLQAVFERLSNVLAGTAHEKGLEFTTSLYEDQPIWLTGDPTRLGQVLTNLANNAIKFTSKGRVAVRAQLVESREQMVTIRFSVSDTGVGIAPDLQPKLFEAFTQADGSTTRKYGGFGLGLSISRHLVELMGGTLELESEVEQGSEFYFSLKLETSVAGEVLSDDPTPEALKAVLGARILVAEDHKVNQLVAQEILEGAGMKVSLANDGKEAVQALKDGPFDAVLMDIHMPEMDGYEAARTIRTDQTFRDLPIIAMTADAMSGSRELCLEAGMNDYITKPIDVRTLVATLARYLEVSSAEAPLESPGSGDSESQLPLQIPGIDVKQLLRRLGGGKVALRTILLGVAEKTDPDAIEDAWRANDIEEALRLVHAMKGLAGNISATELHQKTIQLEHLLSTRDEDQIPTAFSEHGKALRKVLASCAALAEKPETPNRPDEPSEVELQTFLPEFIALDELLVRRSFAAGAAIQKLRRSLGQTAVAEFEALVQEIQKLDYAAARNRLSTLLEVNGLTLPDVVN
jgi:predicted ATPase/signal transduction histidine kinase/DNA-binding response OmpR family regulator/tRNA A-37 threonylcarbamoyl transferase component Bud32/HPt (histidine-containing phosphotransfer) domain-containing protein